MTDTYVDASAPSIAFGTDESLAGGVAPKKVSLLRFKVRRLARRTVTSVRLRLHQETASHSPGRVFLMRETPWNEATTWRTRPTKRTKLADFRAARGGTWIDVGLGRRSVTRNGYVSLAIESRDPDGVTWSSADSENPPELTVKVKRRRGLVLDGVSEVAHHRWGSSDPTYYSNQHRLAVTASGRLLAVHGRHAEGVQLAWRDPGGGWQSRTRGRLRDGVLKRETGTGDWPASIAVSRDASGTQHAWVVWSAPSIGSVPKTTVEMRKLSRLNAAKGPTVGPLVSLVTSTVPVPSLGVARVDLAFERARGGRRRGVVTWLSKSDASSYALMTGWFSDLQSDTPQLHDVRALFTGSAGRGATVESGATGTRVVVRGPSGALQVFRHDRSDDLTDWSALLPGIPLDSRRAKFPAATVMPNGDTVAVVENDTDANVLTVQRWKEDSAPPEVLAVMAGYKEPTITSDGKRVRVIAVRASDGKIVSRQVLGPGGSTAVDRVEVRASKAGDASYPNAIRRSSGRLRLIARGFISGTTHSSVIAFQRRL